LWFWGERTKLDKRKRILLFNTLGGLFHGKRGNVYYIQYAQIGREKTR